MRFRAEQATTEYEEAIERRKKIIEAFKTPQDLVVALQAERIWVDRFFPTIGGVWTLFVTVILSFLFYSNILGLVGLLLISLSLANVVRLSYQGVLRKRRQALINAGHVSIVLEVERIAERVRNSSCGGR